MATREQINAVLAAIIDWKINMRHRLQTGTTDGGADIERVRTAMTGARLESCRYKDVAYVVDGEQLRTFHVPHIMEILPE